MAERAVRLRLRIDLDWADMQRYYRGEMPRITACTEDGRRVILPTNTLRDHLRQDGVHGWFAMKYDANSKRILVFQPLD